MWFVFRLRLLLEQAEVCLRLWSPSTPNQADQYHEQSQQSWTVAKHKILHTQESISATRNAIMNDRRTKNLHTHEFVNKPLTKILPMVNHRNKQKPKFQQPTNFNRRNSTDREREWGERRLWPREDRKEEAATRGRREGKQKNL